MTDGQAARMKGDPYKMVVRPAQVELVKQGCAGLGMCLI